MLGFWIAMAARMRGYDTKRHKRVMGLVRVTLYALVVSLGLGIWSFRSAKAEIGRSSLVLGRDLAQVADLLADPKVISMNGQPVRAATVVVPASTKEVLDRFEAHCKEAPGALGDAWTQVAKLEAANHGSPFDALAKSAVSPGVVRHEARGEGVVMCLTKGTHTPGTIGEAMSLFRETHDLGTLGKLRYAYARPAGEKTLVLTVWTEDSFRLDALFPSSGDAPGTDPPELERPPGSTRILSVSMANTPFGVFVYRSMETPGRVVEHYDARMKEKGWIVIVPPGAKSASDHGYMKDGVVFTLAAGRDDDGGTLVSIGEMDAQAH
jgi:hypothetical protein